ncbi:MAG: hypothetical protein GY798_19100 [Hyphomicrobiales bacterium]|nr:hypothetical protein [Hyphomicrobiales bacterium]
MRAGNDPPVNAKRPTPPKPPFALSLGVVGHRPNRLPEKARPTIEDQLDHLLADVKRAAQDARIRHRAVFADGPAELTMISALAEGGDRMAAQAALRNDMTLATPLPFPIGDYEKDFTEAASRAEYADLLDRSSTVLVLPGDYEAETRDYDGVGQVILDNADLIVAIWDGGPSAGRGGTTDLVERAVAMGLPIVHIDAAGVADPRLLWAELADYPVVGAGLPATPTSPVSEVIAEVVDAIARPPTDDSEKASLLRFFDERWKRLNWRIELPLMLAALGLRAMRKTDLLPPAPAALSAEVDLDAASVPGVNPQRLATVAKAFGTADAVAVRQAQIFRGAYVSKFFFAAMVVITAAASLVGQQLFGWETWLLAVLQIGFVGLVLINTSLGRSRDWHGRWRDAREAAERIRGAIPLWLLGEVEDNGRSTGPAWPAWYTRAHLRALGLRPGALDRKPLEAARQVLIALADGQSGYHQATARLMTRIEKRLVRIGQVLFAATFLLGAANLVLALVGLDLPFNWRYAMIGLTAAMPALGSATFGIRLIGDFEGAADRSARVAETLDTIAAALRQDPAQLAVLRARARSLAGAMLGDVSHWRMATETRKLINPL